MKFNKNVIKVICFSVIFCVLFGCVQNVFIQKKLYGKTTDEPNTNMIGGFYELPKNSLDVVFIGSSNMFCDLNPLALYKEQGIASYILGTSSQQLDATYFLLKEALKTQKPEVVVIETRAITYEGDANEAYNHYVFDHTPLSLNKVEGVVNTTEIIPDDSVVNYLLPITKYHTRWKELNKDDLLWFAMDKSYPLKGYYARYNVSSVDTTKYHNKISMSEIPLRNQEYLQLIINTCEENNVKLLFLKTPVYAYWRQGYSDLMDDFAQKNNIPFIDLNELNREVNIDTTTDFFDDGKHLNDDGAVKVAEYMGKYLRKNYDLPDHRGEEAYQSWEEDWHVYQADRDRNTKME